MKGLAIVVMGVTGSGKTTIGTLLAKALHCNFIDADDFHSVENKGESVFLASCQQVQTPFDLSIDFLNTTLGSRPANQAFINKEKMRSGIPLTDEDRIPWLEAIRDVIIDHLIKGKIVIVACSALQPMYREILRTADPEHAFTFYDKVTSEETEPISFSSKFEGQGYTKSLFSRKVIFVCLQASAEQIASRLEARDKEGEHFMSPALLQSQIGLLQIDEAESVFYVDATLRPEITVEKIHGKLTDSQLIS